MYTGASDGSRWSACPAVRDNGTGRIDPWADDVAPVDRFLQRKGIPPGITDRREAVREIGIGGLGSNISKIACVLGEYVSERHLSYDVFVHGDEARRHGAAAAIDHGDVVGLSYRQRFAGDGLDLVVLDQDVHVLLQLVRLAVEDVDVTDQRQRR
jgi:hypothetical protein